MIIKDGVVIHSFKTMDDFIKQQPINFISDEEDEDEDGEGSSEEENSNQETVDKGDGDENKSSNDESDGKIVDTIIDADLTQVSTDIHESEQGWKIIPYHFPIVNNGNLQELEDKVQEIVKDGILRLDTK
jgi:hypothetical protein